MKRIKKLVKLALVLGLLAVFALTGWLVYLAQTRKPVLDGVVQHPSLTGEVKVLRDDWGVPHITAQNEPDAYFALGYVMAQDRLFQMEAMRRLAAGELAALLGPPLVPVDKLARSFLLRRKAEQYFATVGNEFAEVRAATEAFVAGINHSMETDPLPFEYAVLGMPARPFTAVDCLTVAAILPISFADGLRQDPLVSLLKERLPNMDVDELFPGYHREVPVTIMESLQEAEAFLREQRMLDAEPAAKNSGAGVESAALESLLASLRIVSKAYGPALGSNSWVLAPSRSKSGKPLLANDPHIGFTNPSIWYEAHLKYGQFENYGYHLPLIPFPLIGHNRDRGWGMTMFANDDVDLYQETFHPDDPDKVMYKGQWVDVEEVTETIKVRFGEDRKFTIRLTNHGPVITDLFRLMLGYEGPDVVLAWVWQQVKYTDMLAIHRMGHARDYDSFRDAVSYITSPGINVSYADGEGNIAWWAGGRVTIRPDHVNPKALLDGASGKDEVVGYLPFDQNPHLKNPPCGFIVTANNKSTVKPVGAVRDLQGYWQPGDRAGRIEQMLEEQDRWSLEELKKLQFDDRAYAAPRVVQRITDEIEASGLALSAIEEDALNALVTWDFRHGVDSVGASIYQVLTGMILEDALVDEMGVQFYTSYSTLADHWNFFKYFIEEPGSAFWDDVNTAARETRQDIIVAAFKGTVAGLDSDLGGDVAAWTWGSIHTMEFKHPFGYLPLLGKIFNIGPFPSSGAAQVVNNMLYMEKERRFDVVAGPSTRRLIDFADPEHSLTVLPTGNSGNFMSPHYDDQAEMFMAGEYREVRLTNDQVADNTRHTLRFTPGT